MRSHSSYLSGRRRDHLARLALQQRKLSSAQDQQVARLKDVRGMTWSAIAAYFTRNGTPITYKTAQKAYGRAA